MTLGMMLEINYTKKTRKFTNYVEIKQHTTQRVKHLLAKRET